MSGRSNLAEAIRQPLRHWQGLAPFLKGDQLVLDTNILKRTIRPTALV